MQRLGLIGGTGLDQWDTTSRSHAVNSAFGRPSADLEEFQLADLQVFFLPRHGNRHEFPPHAVNYRANIDAFRQLGVAGIIAVNAVGGISSANRPGMLTIPDQLIDYTWGREHTFSSGAGEALLHVEFARPFDGGLRRGLVKAAEIAGVNVLNGGCIGVTQGPRLETVAEVRRLQKDGCDMVGMTTMPEAALAREAGLEYASLCINANWAAGLENTPVTMEAIEATLKQAMVGVRRLLGTFFEEFSNAG
jgi:5'-methylthioinosine phosphorylase